jgi:predicted PhzF superfamily epimerase YddE/YHI9
VIVPAPAGIEEALGVEPVEVAADDVSYLARVQDARAVRDLSPDFGRIAALDRLGVLVTAEGDEGYDFVSRYFAPAQGIPEDPVTGSAHCALVPYWAQRSGKTQFHAFQASSRGGEIHCRAADGRVRLQGTCRLYMQGEAEI